MIFFGFKGSFIVNGFEAGIAFRGLSKTNYIETFFLAGTEVKAGVGTRGTETEAGVIEAMEIAGTIGIAGTEARTETGVARALEIFRIIGVVRTAGIEAKVTLAMGMARTAETRAEVGTGVALGIEAFSYAWFNKSSR
jgi:hypothetical protein